MKGAVKEPLETCWRHQLKRTSIDLLFLGRTELSHSPLINSLSHQTGVHGCGQPSDTRLVCIERSIISVCMLANRAASSASPAEATTTGVVVDMQWRGEFRKFGVWSPWVMHPPALGPELRRGR
jgi:hypothetical protein